MPKTGTTLSNNRYIKNAHKTIKINVLKDTEEITGQTIN